MGYEVEGRWHLNQWACNLSTQEKDESQLRVPSNRRWIPCLTENKHRKKPRLHLLINRLDEFRNMIQMYTKAKATNPSKKATKARCSLKRVKLHLQLSCKPSSKDFATLGRRIRAAMNPNEANQLGLASAWLFWQPRLQCKKRHY